MNTIKNNYYVYIYLDPRKTGIFIYDDLKFDHEPFYVGKGRGNRIIKSLNDPFSNKMKKLKIKEIKDNGLEPITIIIKKDLSENESYFLEKNTILKTGIENITNKSKGSSSRTFLKVFQNIKNGNIVFIVNSDSKFYELNNGRVINKKDFYNEFKKI